MPKQSVRESTLQLLNTTTTNKSSLAPDADASRREGDITVYTHYIKSMGLFLAAFSLFFAAL